MKFAKCLVILMLFGSVQTLAAQSAGDTTLTGKWKFNNRSTMVLTETAGSVTGTWQDAVGSEACPVTGTDTNGIVNLHVACKTYRYDLKLEGLASLNNNMVRGKSLQNDLVPGDFMMERIICFLPEGCTNG
jgi:hypothetical protein